MPTHEQRVRGARAAQLLEDPTLLEALAAMRDDLDTTMLTPSAVNPDDAVRLIHARHAIHDFEAKLRVYVQQGADPETPSRSFA